MYLDVEITAEQEKLRDPEGFAAIKELHRLMDDDQSGSIDRFESADVSTISSTKFLFLVEVFDDRRNET